MRVLIFACLISNCIGLDLEHNCTFENYIICSKIGYGYPKPGDIPLLNRKIVGGRHVSILEHPYVVSIRRQYSHYLVGTLIGGNLVATVAHPLVDIPIIELGVVVGQNYNDRGSSIYTVILIVFHNLFNPATLEADLALLRLHETLEYKSSVKPIKHIISHDFSFIDSSIGVFATGWGRCDVTTKEFCLPRTSIYFKDEISDPLLRSVHMYITENTEMCNIYRRYDVQIRANMLCVGPARQTDHSCACLAVPGAPLVTDGKLLGLLSWGFGCAYHTDMPLVYTDLRAYRRWLSSNIFKFNDLTEYHFDDLFQATKTAIVTEWFAASRPDLAKQDTKNGHIQAWNIDKALALLDGNVFDIRDFYGGANYRIEKEKRYQLIRESLFPASKDKPDTANGSGVLDRWNMSLSDSSSDSSDSSDYEPDYDPSDAVLDFSEQLNNQSLNSAEENL